MIQSAAPLLSPNLAQVAGKTTGASVNGAESGSFSSILEVSESTETETTELPSEQDAALAAQLPALAGGKAGKPIGKILPGMTAAVSADRVAPADEAAATETDSAAAPADQPLLAPATPAPDFAFVSLALAGMMPAPAKAAIVTDSAPAPSTFTGSSSPAATAPELIVTNPLVRDPATLAAPAPAGRAAAATTGFSASAAVAAASLAPIEVVSASEPEPAGSSTSARLAAISQQVSTEQAPDAGPTAPAAGRTAPVVPEAQAQQAAVAAAATSEDSAAGKDGRDSSPRQSAVATAVVRGAERDIEQPVRIAAKSERAAASPLASIADGAMLQSAAAATTPGPVNAAPAVHSAPAAEAPQDFATLVARLAEAREAADPQLVRTALNHAEFGRISLQFRHEDNGLSVTLANSDPSFAGAVQAAASASLTGGRDNGGDEAARHQQQYTPATSQQHATTSGSGTGSGNGQNQQARANQPGRENSRGQGTTSRPQDQQASTPRQIRGGTRTGGGVFA